MSILASLAVLVLLPQAPPQTPQGNGQGGTDPDGRAPLLTPAEQQSLRDKMANFIKSDDAYDRATAPKDREKASKEKMKKEEAFDKEWDKLGKRGNLLASMADLRAMYENCFLLERPQFSLGQLREEAVKADGIKYSFFLPKEYKADKPMRTVVVLPGTAAAGAPAPQDNPYGYTAAWAVTAQ